MGDSRQGSYTRHSHHKQTLATNSQFSKISDFETRIRHVFQEVKPRNEFYNEICQEISQSFDLSLKNYDRYVELADQAKLWLQLSVYEHAIRFSTDAIRNAPHIYIRKSGESQTQITPLCSAYMTRAKVYFKFQEYDNALFDAEQSMKIFVTMDMIWHKVVCLRFLRRHLEAIQTMDDILAQELLYTTQLDKDLIEKLKQLKPIIENELQLYWADIEKGLTQRIPKVDDLWINRKCKFAQSGLKGRYLMAMENINCNETLMEEKAVLQVLHREYLLRFCTNCLKQINMQFWPCWGCNEVIFCDRKCSREAWGRFHRYECGLAALFYIDGGVSANWIQAFRILLRAKQRDAYKLNLYLLRHFEKTRDIAFNFDQWILTHQNRDTKRNEKTLQESHEELEAILTFLDHTMEQNIGGILHLVFMGIEYATIIQITKAFEFDSNETFVSFAALFIQIMLKCSYNGFGFTEDKKNDFASSLYIMGCFINNSCDPNAVTDTSNGNLKVIPLRDINKDEDIGIGYGPTKEIPFETRMNIYKTQYLFSCKCKTCFDEVKRLRCVRCRCGGPVFQSLTFVNDECLACDQKYPGFANLMTQIDANKQNIVNKIKDICNNVNVEQSYQSGQESYEFMRNLLCDDCDEWLEIDYYWKQMSQRRRQ